MAELHERKQVEAQPFLCRSWLGGLSHQPAVGTHFAWSADARLAILLGARPANCQRNHQHVFALLRGVVVDVLVCVHNASGMARASGAPTPAADLVAAAASEDRAGEASVFVEAFELEARDF